MDTIGVENRKLQSELRVHRQDVAYWIERYFLKREFGYELCPRYSTLRNDSNETGNTSRNRTEQRVVELELKTKNLERCLETQERHKHTMELDIKNAEVKLSHIQSIYFVFLLLQQHIKNLEEQLMNALEDSKQLKRTLIEVQRQHEDEDQDRMQSLLNKVHQQLSTVSQQVVKPSSLSKIAKCLISRYQEYKIQFLIKSLLQNNSRVNLKKVKWKF